MRLLLILSASLWACTDPVNAPVTLVERDGVQPDGGATHVLSLTWRGFQVPTEGGESVLAIIRAPDGGGSALRFRPSTRPAGNGGQLQQMSFERLDFGATSGPVVVPYLPASWCAPSQQQDCPSSYSGAVTDPRVLSDGSLVVAVRFGSASPPADFEKPQRLLRFSFDGGLLLNVAVEPERLTPPARHTVLNDGTYAVSYSRGAGFSSAGVAIELRAADDGALRSTSNVDSAELADSGVGLVARATPLATRLVPLRDGGFLVVGHVDLSRDIACGTQNAPRPGGCGQSLSHAMLVKFDAQGKQVWRRDLGRDFEQPGSYFVDAAELEDGSLVATGHVERRTTEWLEPEHGSLVVRFSATGAIATATRFCPCTRFLRGGSFALASNPRAVRGGGYELIFRDVEGVATAARFSASDDLVASERLPRKSGTQQFTTTASGWAFFNEAELNHVEFLPR